jgi:hypothetical protein
MATLDYAGRVGDKIHMYSSEDEAKKRDKCARRGCSSEVVGIMVWNSGDGDLFSPLCQACGELFFAGRRQ